MTPFFRVTWALLKREVIRFVRQKNRIIGALGTPLVFWILIGSGLKNSFHSPFQPGQAGSDYLLYFFPGTVVLILLFTAIFSTISIIEDRREGFLQGVLVAPISRSAFVFGNLMGGTVLATLQGLLFLGLTPLLNIHLSWAWFGMIVLTLTLLSFGLTGLGFLMAWRLDSTQGFHAIMNLFLMPLWLLSGALFPLESAPAWLKHVMTLNPLTYSVKTLQRGLFADPLISQPSRHDIPSLLITGFFAVLMFLLARHAALKTKSQ